jgi:ankyrin repeat protein
MLKKRLSWNLLFIFFVLFASATYADGETPRKTLSLAISKGDLPQVQSLIESKAVGIEEVPENNYDGSTPLVEAAESIQFPIMKYLIEQGSSVEGLAGKKSTPLTKLIEKGGIKLSCQQLIEMVRFLIDAGADVTTPGKEGYTPLMNACKYTRCQELMELLLDAGAVIDAKADDENTAFFLSIRSGNVKAFRFLISHKANTSMSCKGFSPLGVAAYTGQVVMAKLIVEELKADVNKYDPLGGTPICWAALAGQDAMILFLAEQGADINAKTKNSLDIERPQQGYIVRLGKTYVTFPKNSTPLNFAKGQSLFSTINLISDLGGVEYQEFEYNEWTDFGFGRRYR